MIFSGEISVELVPRRGDEFHAQCVELKQNFPQIDTINVPDLKRYAMRSWDACHQARDFFARRIPHLRAMDFEIRRPELIEEVAGLFRELLVVQGDPVVGVARSEVHDTASFVAVLRERFPFLKIFVALDPYRASVADELRYLGKKIEAGADGFFTQPFFDRDLLGRYSRSLRGIEGYWGLSPVLTERSRSYWERVNGVEFPKNFETSLAANQAFARETIEQVHGFGGNIYLMPIKAGLTHYLSGVLYEEVAAIRRGVG